MLSYDYTIYTFLIFSFLVLIKLLYCGDAKDGKLQKIFGGTVVLITALISKNPWAIGLSIFIGGLIIASEDFMKFFAAIMKTSSDRIPDTITAWKTKEIDPEEKNKKIEKEIEEIEEVEEVAKKDEPGTDSVSIDAEENIKIESVNYDKILPRIENLALSKLEESLDLKIKRQMEILGLKYRFDGVSADNDRKSLRFFEVKIFPQLPRNKNGKIMIFAIVESLRRFFDDLVVTVDDFLEDKLVQNTWKYKLTVVVVLNTDTNFVKIRNKIKGLSGEFNSKAKNFNINFVFYNLNNIDWDLSEQDKKNQ